MKKLFWIFCFVLLVIQAQAQRNNFKLLGYGYNAIFSSSILISSSSLDDAIFKPNHSFAFGYERTIGRRVSVGINYYLTGSVDMAGDKVYYNQPDGDFYINQYVSGSGWMYESRYYFEDFDDGAPDGSYVSINLGRYSFTNKMVVTETGSPNPDLLGTLNHNMTINKLGLRYGIEKTNGLMVAEYYLGADMNFWKESFDKTTHIKYFDENSYQNNFSFTMGIIIGLNL